METTEWQMETQAKNSVHFDDDITKSINGSSSFEVKKQKINDLA